jgi:serine protease Do
MRRFVGMFSLAGLVVLGQSHPAARPVHRALEDYGDAIEAIAKATNPSVVQIAVELRTSIDTDDRHTGFVAEQRATGSGVVVDCDGYILTNAHVVNGARKIQVTLSEQGSVLPKILAASLVGLDRDIDLAVIKVEAKGLPTLEFMDSDTLRQGQFVLALGNPLGLEHTLTAGIISATKRYLKTEDPMYYIQTDAPINPGNSGGPLLDSVGRIAGINTLILTQGGGSEGIGFAIPSNVASRIYQTLRKDGRVHRGAIGIIPQSITPVMTKALGLPQDSGVIIADVAPRGAAEAAGLEPGDIVVSADGKPIRAARELVAAIFQSSDGDQLTLEVLRGKEKKQLKVAVVQRASDPDRLEDLAARDGQLVRRLGVLAVPVDAKVNAILPSLRRFSGVAVAAIPAEFAGRNPGLLGGDVIYTINNKAVGTVEALQTELYSHKPGDPMTLHLERRGQLIYLAFELE